MADSRFQNRSSPAPLPSPSSADFGRSTNDASKLVRPPAKDIPPKAQAAMFNRIDGNVRNPTFEMPEEPTAPFTDAEASSGVRSPNGKGTPAQTRKKVNFTEVENQQILEGISQGLSFEEIVAKYNMNRTAEQVKSRSQRMRTKQAPQATSEPLPQGTQPTPTAAPVVIDLVSEALSTPPAPSTPAQPLSASGTIMPAPAHPLLSRTGSTTDVMAGLGNTAPPSGGAKRKANSALPGEPDLKQRKLSDHLTRESHGFVVGGGVPIQPTSAAANATSSSNIIINNSVQAVELQKAQAELQKAQAEMQRLQSELQKTQAELQKKTTELTTVASTLDHERKSYDAQQASLKAEGEWKQRAVAELIEVLREKARNERSQARALAAQNSNRLGHIGYIRSPTDIMEHWVEGKEMVDLRSQKAALELEIKQVEKIHDQLKDSRKGRRRSGAGATSAATTTGADESEDTDAQLEIYKFRIGVLQKQIADIDDKLAGLEIEKALLIKELKRIADEDHSERNHFPVLSDGTVSQRYLLLHLVGKGGFSEVYQAFDLLELRYVACKIHQMAHNWSQQKRESYFRHATRESKIQAQLSHPRVVRLLHVFEIDRTAFCTVMEYCKGGDLDTYLRQQRVLPENEARLIVSQIFQGLRYMNEQPNPVIHYDLKPGNIMFDEFGGVKITDFGLSKLMDSGDSSIELTSQGAGTYWYLPPECFESPNSLGGQVKISSKVDVWSCGVIFFQLLYGTKPFGNGQSQQKILMDNLIARSELVFPEVVPKGGKVSNEAKDFIRRLLTRNHIERPDVFKACADPYLQPKRRGTMAPPSSRSKKAQATAAAIPATAASAASSSGSILQNIQVGANAGVPSFTGTGH